MKNTQKTGTKDLNFILEGALAFIKSGQYEQMFGKIKGKKQKQKRIITSEQK